MKSENPRLSTWMPWLIVFIFFILLILAIWQFWPRQLGTVIESLTLSYTQDGPALTDISLNEAADRAVVAYGAFYSEKGCEVISNSSKAFIEARLYYSKTPCERPEDQDDAACLWARTGKGKEGKCEILDCVNNAPRARYACVFQMPFFAKSTDEGSEDSSTFWVAGARGRQGRTEKSEERQVIAEVLTLTALELPGKIIYGDVLEGGVSQDIAMFLRNTGNNPHAKIMLSGTDFLCNNGKAPVGLLRYSFDGQKPYEERVALTVLPRGESVWLSPQARREAKILQSIYWMVQAPEGVGEACKNRVFITATP